MKSCEVAQDLMPLYVEGLTNEGSSTYVEQHIADCTQCRGYFEMIQQDYTEHVSKKPEEKKIDDLVAKLSKYQRNIKLVGVLVAMLMSCIITGAEVQLLSTLPFLLLTPFISRLYYNKSMPIIISSIPFGLLGGVLSEQHSSFIPFFTVIALITACIGVGAGVLVKLGVKQTKISLKAVYILPVAALLMVSCIAYFSFFGNPIGYTDTMIKTRSYVNQTYEDGTLTFKGIGYNFKDHRHYGKFEYVLNGTRQVESIEFRPNGEVYDRYQYILDLQFSAERSAELKAEIAAAINYKPLMIEATPEVDLRITQDDMNDRYYHLSYDLDKRNEATERRERESGKLNYGISFGAFIDEYELLPQEQFIVESTAILRILKEHSVPYNTIEIKAKDLSGNIQSVNFHTNTTEEQLIGSYQSMPVE